MHLVPGSAGLACGVLFFLAIWAMSYRTKSGGPFNFDPKGEKGAFEPFMAKYLRLAEFIIGLATGSIVLLVGSSVLHGQGGHLPWFYASPLLLLGSCVVYAVFFMVWLIFSYEDYRHDNPHTRFKYSLNEALGFSSLSCFVIGYLWLVFVVKR